MASIVITRTTFAIVVILLHLTSTTKTQQDHYQSMKKCNYDAANYTANSNFEFNLKKLLNNLKSKAFATKVHSHEEGGIPDRVYGLYLCRGDVDSETCPTCIDVSAIFVLRVCRTKAAIVWHEKCMLQYSNRKFKFKIEDDDTMYAWNDYNVTSEWPRFNHSLMSLLGQLRLYAAYNTLAPPPRMFATGLFKLKRQNPSINALVQCTSDLTPDQCNDCLTYIISQCHLKGCNPMKGLKRGGRVLAPSCNLRYELYRFYYGTPRISLPATKG